MAVAEVWRELHRDRFPELPLDCGRESDPGVIYSEDLRDWSDKATTPDQARMERYIDRYDLKEKRILHIGIGNSGLAKRFGSRAAEIVGTTIDEPEMKVANSLGVPSYSFKLHNKYSSSSETIPGKFDFILDNNPSSPCCCVRHLARLFDLYVEKLADDGQIVTDSMGLGWIPEDSNARWSFDFEDLAAIGRAVGLSAFRMTGHVYVLSRSAPAKPPTVPRMLHIARRAKELPGQILRSGPRKVVLIFRSSARWLLVRTVPWALPARFRR